MTKTQEATKSLPHMKRTLVKIPYYLRGFQVEKLETDGTDETLFQEGVIKIQYNV